MPKKACCCGVTPDGGSCCRPIYNNCVGNQYEYTFQVTAKYPCYNYDALFTPARYSCQSPSTITHDIAGNAETFEITVQYTIDKPAELPQVSVTPNFYDPYRIVPFNLGQFGNSPENSCGSYGCFGPNYDPNNANTWSIPTFGTGFPNFSCPGCYCYNDPIYSYCNFNEDKLLNCLDKCKSGWKPYIYACYDGSGNTAFYQDYYTENQIITAAPCGTDGFGNPIQSRLIQNGNAPTHFWGSCYETYILKQRNNNFEPLNKNPPGSNCFSGCTWNFGDTNFKNIADSYSIQFIPNPNIPEQNDPTYTPRLQPELINFTFVCTTSPFFTVYSKGQGYSINVSMGFGYAHKFNCGTVNDPILELLDIPFQIGYSSFSGLPYYDGLYINQWYNRESMTTDPMNLCVPPSTNLYPRNSCNNGISRCKSEILYRDDYTNCTTGREEAIAGDNLFGLQNGSFLDIVPLMQDSCGASVVEDNARNLNYCNYIQFTNKIQVTKIT